MLNYNYSHCSARTEFSLFSYPSLSNVHIHTYIHKYIISRPFPIGVGRDHILPLATILTQTFRFLHFETINIRLWRNKHTHEQTHASPVTSALFLILTYIHTAHSLSSKGQQRYLRYSFETPKFHQNYLAMRNTADVTSDKPITVWLQSISGVSAIKSFNRLLRHPWKKERGAIFLFCLRHHIRHYFT
jgi:hypothetical protein